MATETISVRDLTAAHLRRTTGGHRITGVEHLPVHTCVHFILVSGRPAGSELRYCERFCPNADGTWPTIELDVDPFAEVPLPERWLLQTDRDHAVDYTREDSARRSFEGCAPPARLVHLSAAGATVIAVKL